MQFVDFNKKQKRYLQIKLQNGWVLDIEEPNLHTLEQLQKTEKTNDVDDLVTSVEMIINRNKQKRKMKRNDIKTLFTYSDMQLLMESYLQFVQGIQNDPN